jgi:hypothetical protein
MRIRLQAAIKSGLVEKKRLLRVELGIPVIPDFSPSLSQPPRL